MGLFKYLYIKAKFLVLVNEMVAIDNMGGNLLSGEQEDERNQRQCEVKIPSPHASFGIALFPLLSPVLLEMDGFVLRLWTDTLL